MVHAFFLLKSALIAVTVSSAIAASDLVKFVVSPNLKSIVGVKQEVGVLIHKLGQLNLVKELRGRVYTSIQLRGSQLWIPAGQDGPGR